MQNFYPRSPCGERQAGQKGRKPGKRFLSTLSLRRATLFLQPYGLPPIFLSTLSLRRATLIRLQQAVNDMKFLSTLSLRRATGGYGCAYLYLIISIHALLAESDGMTEFIGALFDISIHALLAESDLPVFLSGFWAYLFLSTLSLRRATRLFLEIYTLFKNFYPRSPCGERLRKSCTTTL